MKMYHWFIPNKKNKFHPIALRKSGLIIFTVLILSIPIAYNLITTNKLKVLGYATNININDLFKLSNIERENRGVAPLKLDKSLSTAAYEKAKDMMKNNYWAHVSPDGTTPWIFVTNAGYEYSLAGENLAKDFNSSNGVVGGWMNSPLHRENLLNTNYQDVGYAIIDGNLEGSDTTLVVAMYGQSTKSTITANNGQLATPESDIATNHDVNIDSSRVIGAKSSVSPIKIYSSLNWGQKISILLISTLILLFIMKHTLIWREKKRGVKDVWLRAHPLGQAFVLLITMALTIASGVGVVL